jgi:glycosyltransferase XagB
VVQLLLIGMVVSPLVHPFLLALILWAVISDSMMPSEPNLAASMATGFGAVVFIAGYAVAFASQRKGIKQRGLADFGLSVASMPIYWLLISAAAWMAVWELFRRPYHWNKTEHGLSNCAQMSEEVERAMGIEPTTSSLGSLRSTTELRPPRGSTGRLGG